MARSRGQPPPLPAPDVQALFGAPKTFAIDPVWHVDEHNRERFILSVPLCIDYVVEEGLFLDAHCPVAMPDTDVTFNLSFKPAYGYSGALSRLDWNPLHTHDNKGLVKGEWKWKRMYETHFHPFADNYACGLQWMFQNNLPIAYPLVFPLQNFREMLDYLGQTLQISDVQRIAPPIWAPRFL